MPGTMFHLIRHGSHSLLGQVLVGRGAVPINAAGEREAASVAAALVDAELSALLTSPQLRARQTAAAISRHLGQPATVEPGIDELDMGQWTGMEFKVLEQDPQWRAFNRFRGSTPTRDGETMLSVQARVLASMLRLRTSQPGGTIALVSHADVIKAALAHFLGVSLDLMHRIDIAPGSRSIVELYDEDVVVRAINLPPGS